MKETEFPQFCEQLTETLQRFKEDQQGKKQQSKAKAAQKRKAAEEEAASETAAAEGSATGESKDQTDEAAEAAGAEEAVSRSRNSFPLPQPRHLSHLCHPQCSSRRGRCSRQWKARPWTRHKMQLRARPVPTTHNEQRAYAYVAQPGCIYALAPGEEARRSCSLRKTSEVSSCAGQGQLYEDFASRSIVLNISSCPSHTLALCCARATLMASCS